VAARGEADDEEDDAAGRRQADHADEAPEEIDGDGDPVDAGPADLVGAAQAGLGGLMGLSSKQAQEAYDRINLEYLEASGEAFFVRDPQERQKARDEALAQARAKRDELRQELPEALT
jgi:hypothetical protein